MYLGADHPVLRFKECWIEQLGKSDEYLKAGQSGCHLWDMDSEFPTILSWHRSRSAP